MISDTTLLVGGIGGGSLIKLNNQGIKVYNVANDTVSKNVELFRKNELIEFSSKNICNYHECNH